MLTKQKRDEIVKRAKDELDKDEIDYADLYAAITGKYLSIGKPFGYYSRIMLSVVLDLCDMSDMVELPCDKDGEVIHIGDTVWWDGDKYQVASIRYDTSDFFGAEVYIRNVDDMYNAFWRSSDAVTHAEPISDHENIARAIEDIVYRLDDAAASLKLQDIAMELRKLGDGND